MAPEIARRASIASSISLALLLLVIGCDLGRQRVWKSFANTGSCSDSAYSCRRRNPGRVMAALSSSPCLCRRPCSGAGFGWYSYRTGGASKKGAETGAYVFLSNLIREISAYCFGAAHSGELPRSRGVPGRATSMDSSSLRFPVRSAEGAAWGLIVGTVLSLACPFVIELVLVRPRPEEAPRTYLPASVSFSAFGVHILRRSLVVGVDLSCRYVGVPSIS